MGLVLRKWLNFRQMNRVEVWTSFVHCQMRNAWLLFRCDYRNSKSWRFDWVRAFFCWKNSWMFGRQIMNFNMNLIIRISIPVTNELSVLMKKKRTLHTLNTQNIIWYGTGYRILHSKNVIICFVIRDTVNLNIKYTHT